MINNNKLKMIQIRCLSSGDESENNRLIIPHKFVRISKLFESMQGENTEADLSKETIPLNVPYEAMKGVLEYCELFNFEPIDQNSEYVPYKIKLQLNPKAIDYGDLMTTKEIMFFQPKNLD